mmetsp:Transcript_21560/g.38239  ORF Transcript_21560/g.38239 Transcript_21560/m.38239 type:complete len:207 (+) Transcript_21560:498-1118(+)
MFEREQILAAYHHVLKPIRRTRFYHGEIRRRVRLHVEISRENNRILLSNRSDLPPRQARQSNHHRHVLEPARHVVRSHPERLLVSSRVQFCHNESVMEAKQLRLHIRSPSLGPAISRTIRNTGPQESARAGDGSENTAAQAEEATGRGGGRLRAQLGCCPGGKRERGESCGKFDGFLGRQVIFKVRFRSRPVVFGNAGRTDETAVL